MTIALALDPVAGRNGDDAMRIAGVARDVPALFRAGFDVSATYTAASGRLAFPDETDTAGGDATWNNDCVPGWYYVESDTTGQGGFRQNGFVQKNLPLTHAQRVAVDIAAFRESVLREEQDVEKMLAQEAISPHADSGHLWSDDVIHAVAKPHIRVLVVLLGNAKATPNAGNIGLYRAALDRFNAVALDPGLLGIYQQAQKAVWRPRRTGEFAWGYDTATGGTRQENGQDVRTAVNYPAGETVATWDALAAVRAL
ncbi:MAG: hypothetical protein OXI79_20375 [Gammaproteobacteria bacterium]|nr:hypothetical protein [Gammaproteobacteria bacterium]